MEPEDALFEISCKLANIALDTHTTVPMDLYTITQLLYTTKNEDCLDSVRQLRIYLTRNEGADANDEPPTIDTAFLQRLSSLLNTPHPDIQFECAWILTNLATTHASHRRAIIDNGFFPLLLHLLNHPSSHRTRIQITWALTNLTAESAVMREQWMIQSTSSMTELLTSFCVKDPSTLDAPLLQDMCVLAWSLSNMCRGGFDCRPYDKMCQAIFESLALCIAIPHQQLCAIACWGLSRLVENVQGSDAFFHTAILPHWLCHHFTDLLSQATHTASFPALSIVSGFIAGSVDSTLALLKENITLPLYRLVTSQPLDAFHDPALKALRRIVEHKDPRIHQLLGPDVVDTALVFIGVPRHVYSEQTVGWMASPHQGTTWSLAYEGLLLLCHYFNTADERGMSYVASHTDVSVSLSTLLHHLHLPLDISLQCVKTLVALITRLNQLQKANLCLSVLLKQGILPSLFSLCQKQSSKALVDQCILLYGVLNPTTAHSLSIMAH